MHNSFCPRPLYHISLDSALARRNHFCGAKAGSLIVIWICMCTMIKTNQLPIYLMLPPEGFVIIVFPIPVFWDASPFLSMQHGEYQLQYVPKTYHIFTNTWDRFGRLHQQYYKHNIFQGLVENEMIFFFFSECNYRVRIIKLYIIKYNI